MIARMFCLWLTGWGAFFGVAGGAEPPLSEAKRQTLKTSFAATIEMTTAQLKQTPEQVDLYSQRGDARFFAEDFAGAVTDYDKMVELDPKLAAAHWRRGIAQFYAGQYKQAAHQFEIYHTYDDVDRENGIWRFFSQAKAHGLKTAREGLLKYQKDDREPFPDVYQLFAEKITPAQILEKIRTAEISATEREKRRFYAHLYIGLNEALHNRREATIEHLAQAVKNTWAQEAGYGPHYMWHVGRVHYNQLTAKKPLAGPKLK